MKKALLLGIFDSTYIVHFINDVLIPLGYDVYIMPDSKKINNAFIPNEKLHVIYSLKKETNNFIINKLLSFKKVYSDIQKLKKLGPFDLIHIHYVSYKAMFIGKMIKQAFNSKLVITYWGSDIMRDTHNENKKNLKYLPYVDYISSDSLVTKKTFFDIYKDKFNLNVIYFGDSICTEIDSLDKTKADEYKTEFSIPENKTIVTIGYNARPAQQHLQVITEIIKSPEKFKDYYFILPMTYCKEDLEYIKKLENILQSSSLNYKIFDSYLSENDIAKLRIISDIFINAQTTDAFCNTIKEFFYLGKIILNPVWLDYPELSEWKLKTISYKEFSELPDLLLNASSYISNEDLTHNKKIFENRLSWENCKENWSNIYNA
ncbi:MAG: glycosyltransferase [Treponema sp.]|nr:glycosyltransferase [Treponema sp.]